MAIDAAALHAHVRENSAWYWGGGIDFLFFGVTLIAMAMAAKGAAG